MLPRLLAATIAFASLGFAQQRGAMTCTVRGPDGRPLAGAEVVCVQHGQPGQDGADRRRGRTGTDGSCALELLVGHGYWLWVIGPRGDDGQYLAAPPGEIAAAGRRLVVDTQLRLAPVRLDVRGAAEWLGDDLGGGPLALRLGVAPGVALGPDIPLPGDGKVQLPPLPDTRFDAALVDGRGELVTSLPIDVAVAVVAQFPATRTFDVQVTDDAGHALPGAMVLRVGQSVLPAADGRGSAHGWSPVAAICDAQGKARCRVAEGDLGLFAAMHDGHTAMVSGWHLGVRFENGHPRGRDADPSAPLTFALPASEASTLRVRGDDVAALSVQFYDFRLLRAGRRSAPALLQFPAERRDDGSFAAAGPSTESSRVALVDLLRQLPVPQRTHVEVGATGRAPRLAELDLAALRTTRVQVLDATGAPVPGARVDVMELGRHHSMPECDVHTDTDGRAELRLARAGYALHASTVDAYGMALAPLDEEEPLRIVMQPMATVRLRVVDARGAPVAGARVEVTGRVEARDSGPPSEAGELADFAAGASTTTAFARARSGADGQLEVRCVDGGALVHLMATAVLGARRGEPVELHHGGEPSTLTLPDAPR